MIHRIVVRQVRTITILIDTDDHDVGSLDEAADLALDQCQQDDGTPYDEFNHEIAVTDTEIVSKTTDAD